MGVYSWTMNVLGIFFFVLFEQVNSSPAKWTGWGQCNGVCDTGFQYRFLKVCPNSNPIDEYEARKCDMEAKCNHAWSTWSSWSQCSLSCGGGMKTKVRQCKDSEVKSADKCEGKSFAKAFCNIVPCDAATCFDPSKPNRQHYRGNQNRTTQGYSCQHWNSTEFNAHEYHPHLYPGSGLDANYCRNPDSDAKPWCFTTDKNKLWDYCDVECKEIKDNTHIQWGQWSFWSSCSASCGSGKKHRIRSCVTGDDHCEGSESESSMCNTMKCGAPTPTTKYYQHTVSMNEPDHGLQICGEYQSGIVGSRIFGGTRAHRGSLPWQVMLVSDDSGKPFCGGTLLNSRTILTAAHCVLDKEVGEFSAYTGRLSYKSHSVNEQKNAIKSIHIHPKYYHVDFKNDIALLITSTRYRLDEFTHPACIHGDKEGIVDHGELVISGWGKAEEGENEGDLLQTTVRVIPYNKCQQIYKHKINHDVICAGSKDGKDACQGDSGGGLIDPESKILYGVTSWGIGCGMANYPGVYTKIASFVDWIRNEVQYA